MGENSKIEWTDHTFNPWIGCTKISAGCTHCYAEALAKRTGLAKWGDEAERVVTSDANWRKPLKWDREAAKAGRRARVFCASLADVFEDRPEVAGWRESLWELISRTPNLVWLLLTKRPNMVESLTPARWHGHWPGNVWLGMTVENQEQADKRLPWRDQWRLSLGEVNLFLSCEPLLGPLDLSPWILDIDWMIVGGESGHAARPMQAEWVRSLRAWSRHSHTRFFFKQWGEHNEHGERVGKKAAGRLLDGREWNELPTEFNGGGD